MDDVIAKWNKNYNLIELVINDLEKFTLFFKKYYNSNQFPNTKKINYQTYVNFNLLNKFIIF